MAQRLMRGLTVCVLLFLLCACSDPLAQERAVLEDYYFGLLADDPAAYSLQHMSDGRWYLFRRDARDPLVENGYARPLDHPAEIVGDAHSGVMCSVTVKETSPTHLRCVATNAGDETYEAVRLSWVEVKLADDWYRLWYKNLTDVKLGKGKLLPGEEVQDGFVPVLNGVRCTLLAGQYRAVIELVRENVTYVMAEFAVPAATEWE